MQLYAILSRYYFSYDIPVWYLKCSFTNFPQPHSTHKALERKNSLTPPRSVFKDYILLARLISCLFLSQQVATTCIKHIFMLSVC